MEVLINICLSLDCPIFPFQTHATKHEHVDKRLFEVGLPEFSLANFRNIPTNTDRRRFVGYLSFPRRILEQCSKQTINFCTRLDPRTFRRQDLETCPNTPITIGWFELGLPEFSDANSRTMPKHTDTNWFELGLPVISGGKPGKHSWNLR